MILLGGPRLDRKLVWEFGVNTQVMFGIGWFSGHHIAFFFGPFYLMRYHL